MEQITMDNQAREKIMARLEGAAAVRAPKRPVRPLRAALLAACVCLALAGSVFAAQTFLGVRFFGGDRSHYQVGAGGLTALTTEDLGPQMARDLKNAAAADPCVDVRRPFRTWQELEDYMGLPLAYNPLLEQSSELRYPVDENDLSRGYALYEGEDPGGKPLYRCYLDFRLWNGKLLNGDVSAYSKLDGVDVDLHVVLYGEADGAPPASFGFGSAYGGENDFRAEDYTMKNGCQAQLVYRYAGAAAPLSCDAYFVENGMFYRLHFEVLKGGPVDPALVQRVLDAFEEAG